MQGLELQTDFINKLRKQKDYDVFFVEKVSIFMFVCTRNTSSVDDLFATKGTHTYK